MIKITLATILSKILNEDISVEQLTSETSLPTDLGLNSLEMLYFIVDMEKAFEINIDLSTFDITMFYHLGTLEQFIQSHLTKKDAH